MTTATMERNPKFVWESAFIESGITGNAGFIGLLMATYDNGDGKGFWVTQKAIARKTGLDEKTVKRSIDKLIHSGWIERTSLGRSGRASEYQLRYPSQTEASASSENSNRTSLADNRAVAPTSTGHQSQPIRPVSKPPSLAQSEPDLSSGSTERQSEPTRNIGNGEDISEMFRRRAMAKDKRAKAEGPETYVPSWKRY